MFISCKNNWKAAAGAVMLFAAGCSVLHRKEPPAEELSGLKIWETRCVHCHNAPEPAMLTDGEWEIAGAHMRTRAYLTEKETQAVVKFLQMTNE
jgi:hypothetical protein